MDETSVRIAYYPDKVVAMIGSESVPMYTNLNLKESFTALMMCTPLKTYPPIILSKGTTDRCTDKFKTEECSYDYQVWYSKDGWTNEEIMMII